MKAKKWMIFAAIFVLYMAVSDYGKHGISVSIERVFFGFFVFLYGMFAGENLKTEAALTAKKEGSQ